MSVQDKPLPIVEACYLSHNPEKSFVLAREDGDPLDKSIRFPVSNMIDFLGEETEDPSEAVTIVFGSDEFGWCVYELEPENVEMQ